jgi:fluoride exporter
MDAKLLTLIFCGSAVGGLARYLLSGWVAKNCGERFPAGTMVVNITGAFVIGCVWSGSGTRVAGADQDLLRDFLAFGFLGGYTTVSSFALNTLTLWQEGQWLNGMLNVFVSLVMCVSAAFAGAALVARTGFL